MPYLSLVPGDARRGAFAAVLVVVTCVVLLAGCAERQRQPAERALAEIDAALAASGTAPVKFIPGEAKQVQGRVRELKRAFARGDFADVVAQAPEVLRAAQALAPAAAAREAELTRELFVEWTELSTSLPAELSAVADRFDRLTARHRPPPGLTADDVRTARDRLRDALSLWDRALAEEKAGRLPEAVTLARQVRDMGRGVDAVSQAGAPAAAVK